MKRQHQLYTVRQTRELDHLAIEHTGVSGYELMRRAGQSVFDSIRRRWPEAEQLTVFCGAGNNAGDGYVVARLAKQAGQRAHVYYLKDPRQLVGEARQAWQACVESGVVMEPFGSGVRRTAGVMVDALVGTGLQRELTGNWLSAVDHINASPLPVVAADIPSGVNADSGHVMGAAVRADMTVAFIGLNRGLFTGQAPAYTGTVVFDDLQVDAGCYQAVSAEVTLMDDDVVDYLRPRSRILHKGQCGHVLVVGGNAGMAGAPVLASKAALRSGAGLVSVATRPSHVSAAVAAQPELMVHAVEDAMHLRPLLAKADVVVIGPGLGQDCWAQSLLGQVLESRLPIVVDADALNLLAKEPGCRADWILTPHVAEAARLLGCSVADISVDRFAAVKKLQQLYGGVTILKGPGSLLATPAVRLCRQGNPGMATAGTGDVLSGVVAALLAQGLPPGHAAELGVWVHARAADKEAAAQGERGLVATDLLPHIRRILNA